jgi:hypothetical protein
MITPENAAFLRAIKGPVLMITVGVLFALDNFTPFSFNRTWPVLLVVAGILSLGRSASPVRGRMRYQAQWGPPRPPVPPPPPTAGPAWAPSGTSTAPPGTYRGSAYEATPGAPGPRGTEPKINREKPGMPEPLSSAGATAPEPPPNSGGSQ